MPFFLIFLMLVGCTRSVPSGTYAPLIEAFNRYETEEARYFERLVFTVSPKVFSNSNTFKVLLRDQTGEEWLFKSSENGASDGIVLVYRIMNLFGMDSPEAHYKTISFNGQMVAGTVQRFIPNRGGIPIWVMRRLKGDPAFYMAKNHVMSWLLANHQVHPDQFLVLPKEPGPVREILRIDNSVNWFLLGQDRIDIDYRTPVLHDFGNIGYLRFWQFFLSGKILISLPEIYQWARFVAGFPDSKYLEFFAPAIKHNLSELANNGAGELPTFWESYPEIKARAPRKADVPGLLVERKNQLPRDLGALYRDLATWRETSLDLEQGWNPEKLASELVQRLDQKTKKILSLDLPVASSQEPLRVRLSLEALRSIRRIAKILNVPFRDREIEFEQIRLGVDRVARTAATREERDAASSALVNLEKFKTLYNAWMKGKVPHAEFISITLDLPKFFGERWPELDELLKIASSERIRHGNGMPAEGEW